MNIRMKQELINDLTRKQQAIVSQAGCGVLRKCDQIAIHNVFRSISTTDNGTGKRQIVAENSFGFPNRTNERNAETQQRSMLVSQT